jgi:hypothetical protein
MEEIIKKASWNEVKTDLFNNYKEGFKFRGHKDSSWKLDSSLERNHGRLLGNKLELYYLHAYRKMVETGLFQYQDHNRSEKCIEYFCNEIDENKDNKKTNGEKKSALAQLEISGEERQLAINLIWQMQHHGIFTQLIDVTLSFYIATYFALFNDTKEINDNLPAIHAIKWGPNRNNSVELLIEKMLKKSRVPPYVHERIIKQQAHYLNSYDSLDKYIRLKYIIKTEWIKDIYKELKLMNINGYVLFGTKEMAAIDYYHAIKHDDII